LGGHYHGVLRKPSRAPSDVGRVLDLSFVAFEEGRHGDLPGRDYGVTLKRLPAQFGLFVLTLGCLDMSDSRASGGYRAVQWIAHLPHAFSKTDNLLAAWARFINVVDSMGQGLAFRVPHIASPRFRQGLTVVDGSYIEAPRTNAMEISTLSTTMTKTTVHVVCLSRLADYV
jgi:hypothetical protein